MAGVLLAQELRSAGVVVYMLHPGFNKSDMTAKVNCKDCTEMLHAYYSLPCASGTYTYTYTYTYCEL
jgi:NAD(P)-dependent dehydrogenase (short-subunit alcohol dehydrogenase family)